MDGNGRWAQRLGRPRAYGHRCGAERVREIVQACPGLGVSTLTLFAFSSENWRRPDYEVSVIMQLARRYIVREIDELDRMDVRVRFIGNRARLPHDIQRLMTQMEERTVENTRLTLQVAISYGSRDEITQAVQMIVRQVMDGKIDPQHIDEDTISETLLTAGIDDPDLVIRTSGEMRISNFLLWQVAYSEFAFVEECWPDFTAKQFAEILAGFGGRERRFGRVAARL